MREIKFRAFLKGENRMIYTDDYRMQILCGEISIGYYHTVYRAGGFELMQYTGLKDKNGKEIYEGDIIAWDYEYDSDYDGDMPIVKRSAGRQEVKDIFDRWRITEAANESKGVEVIGNIYENPELIRK